jgi:hypothetical protein
MMIKSRHVSLRGAGQRHAARDRLLPASGAAGGPQPRRFWFPVICDAAILTIGIGARRASASFRKPIAAARKVGRELWSLANALVMGAFSPFLGDVADRFGTAPYGRHRRSSLRRRHVS